MVGYRVIVMAAGLIALTGCVETPLPPLVPVDTRMRLPIDTYEHKIVHPPFKSDNGRVDPVDERPSGERAYGPQSRLDQARSGSLLATLETFRRGEPDGPDFLGLAKSHKSKVAKREPSFVDADPPDANQPLSAPTSARGVQDQDGGYRLNFEDADIKDVLQAVLGNVLGLTYTIAPNVTGRITISSAATQSRSELLSTLETVLSLQGLSLTKTGSTYRVAPTAVGGGTIDTTGKEPGFGITVVPLEYSSVASMSKLLSGFVTDADGIRIDTARNAIVIRGPGPRRDEIVRAIKNFDQDWMHQQSVSVVELRRSHPDEIIPELNRIFDNDTNGGANGVIEFKAIKRLRSIMVISKNQQLVRRADLWIRRLDHQDESVTDSIFVYRPRYRDAKEMVRLVNGLFNADSGGSSVAFQQQGGSQQEQQRSIGQSTSSFAGGLSTGGLGAGNGLGSSSGTGGGSPLGGSPFGGSQQSGAPGQAGSGSSFGGAGQTGGNGAQGVLADPIEAGQGTPGGGKLKLTADASNNTIVAYTDGETYRKVAAILKQLDVPPLQVAINVIIAEVQLNDALNYGVQFYLNNQAGSIGLVQTAGQFARSTVPGLGGFNILAGGSQSANVVISALDSISKVHILSTPSLVVMENKPATFEVGNQVPVITQTAQSNISADAPTVNSVTYLDTGIILKIIPRVGQNGSVAMDLDQVISAVVPDASGATSTSLTPTISKRRIASDISVRSGQTVLLAGLINDNRQQSRGQVPFVGPALGNLFGNTNNQVNRDELVIFIRPVIIRDGQDAAQVTSAFKSSLHDIDTHPAPVYKP